MTIIQVGPFRWDDDGPYEDDLSSTVEATPEGLMLDGRRDHVIQWAQIDAARARLIAGETHDLSREEFRQWLGLK